MLDHILSSGGQLAPTTGFWGFLLNHWLVISIVVMALGFAADQALYWVRYRPQERWKALYDRVRAALDRRAEREDPEAEDGAAPAAGGTIRRAGAQYRPDAAPSAEAPAPREALTARAAPPERRPREARPEPRPRSPLEEAQALRPTPDAWIVPEEDDDAPVVVRAADDAALRRANREPVTQRPDRRS